MKESLKKIQSEGDLESFETVMLELQKARIAQAELNAPAILYEKSCTALEALTLETMHLMLPFQLSFSSSGNRISKISLKGISTEDHHAILEFLNVFSFLRKFEMTRSNVKSIPVLPSSVDYIMLKKATIEHMEGLPPNLSEFFCYDSDLNEFPILPRSLKTLVFDRVHLRAHLEVLPDLPDGLEHLMCDHSKIKHLPTLPCTLKTLACSDSSLEDLPDLPANMRYIDIHSTPASKEDRVVKQLEKYQKTYPQTTMWVKCLND